MSELGEKRWAVISDRGREASNLTYDEARDLIELFLAKKSCGLCIVTNEAAAHLPDASEASSTESKPAYNPAGDYR